MLFNGGRRHVSVASLFSCPPHLSYVLRVSVLPMASVVCDTDCNVTVMNRGYVSSTAPASFS